MFRKKESEFQYAPGIEKIIEDIQGGGTIARAELKGVIDELPPLVIVGKDPNGLYHVVTNSKSDSHCFRCFEENSSSKKPFAQGWRGCNSWRSTQGCFRPNYIY